MPFIDIKMSCDWINLLCCPCRVLFDRYYWNNRAETRPNLSTSSSGLSLNQLCPSTLSCSEPESSRCGTPSTSSGPLSGTSAATFTGVMKSSPDGATNSDANDDRQRLLQSHTSHTSREPECVICLDEFDNSNPAMMTLCACGENRTLFHYPCLLLWLEKKSTCPNCSSDLYYQVSLGTSRISNINLYPSSATFHTSFGHYRMIFNAVLYYIIAAGKVSDVISV